MRLQRSSQIHRTASVAFTLVEVILAISLAIGILVVALYFQSQVTNLRANLLQESDRIAAIRQVMDRLTADLRNAFVQPEYGFAGDGTSLRFVMATAPSSIAGILRSSVRGATPRADLRLVTYGLSKAIEGTNEVVTGFVRTEQPLVDLPRSLRTFPAPAALSPLDESPNSHTEVAAGASGQSENQRYESAPGSTNTLARGPAPMTDAIRFLRIWYWGGNGWKPTWDSPDLPRGVEISIGAEPLAADASASDFPQEFFRRVIYLPASRKSDTAFEAIETTESDVSIRAPTP